MRRPLFARDLALPAILLLALLGFWMPWLDGPAAALRLNAYELSEWITFLPAVRYGEVSLSRLSFLAPSACLAVLLALAVGAIRIRTARSWVAAILPDSALGWGLLGLAALSALAVLPYYPHILTAYAEPEFQGQFFVAAATLTSVVVALVLPPEIAGLAQIIAGLVGAALSAWALWTLWPVASALLGQSGTIGWGWAVTIMGCLAAAAHGWLRLFRPRW
jgi:hypothetical protein